MPSAIYAISGIFLIVAVMGISYIRVHARTPVPNPETVKGTSQRILRQFELSAYLAVGVVGWLLALSGIHGGWWWNTSVWIILVGVVGLGLYLLGLAAGASLANMATD